MKTFRLTESSRTKDLKLDPSVAAVGFFDGVHRGHQQVIETAKSEAQEQGLKSAVMTFDPHPSVVLKKEKQHAHYITPLPLKQEILEDMGIDYLFVITFDQSLASLSPQKFVDEFFVGLHVEHVVAGFDFSYGHKGQGSMDNLPEFAKGRLEQTVIKKVEKDEEKISSTRIRSLLDRGEVEEVNQLLGRTFTVTGNVIQGDRRGRTIGFPTANVDVSPDYYIPKVGVYAVSVDHKDFTYYGMANLGVKPTFHETADQPNLEIHLFDVDEDLYDQTLKVHFHRMIRDEQKFNGVEELIKQLKQDEATIREFFRKN
ncbi:bifunctional riboflavin kinase/FAD synthetase [Halobacillus yeomjeoni]|uniref:Riboflavin biosynthesis protein n=1 Tax=Halobacillus yeomjeoni TaxID=311194 RepID=A0A931MUJ3_9BACI|nr:bifunctional riboflavin kinase/FAD synthetase [Halobacillus yeomjeoni]MBH0229319.1 bifunctional riboflavin kinase/FAD synthetase [Halobacillus yeomjeoni]